MERPGTPGVEPTPEEVRARLAIDDVLTAYASGLDGRDFDVVRACFTPDARLDYTAFGGPAGGPDEVLAWIESSTSGFEASQHLVVNRRVRVDGDTAEVTSQLLNPLGSARDDGTFGMLWVGAEYRDRFVRTPQGWRIAERVEVMHWHDAPG